MTEYQAVWSNLRAEQTTTITGTGTFQLQMEEGYGRIDKSNLRRKTPARALTARRLFGLGTSELLVVRVPSANCPLWH
jgi:hypothetical protein